MTQPDGRRGVVVTPGDPRRELWSLVHEVHGLVDLEDRRMTALGPLGPDAPLEQFAHGARSSVWLLQRGARIDTARVGAAFSARLARSGVGLRSVASPTAVQSSPLLSSAVPGLRVAPVPCPMVLVDARVCVVAGPHGENAWSFTEPDLVARTVDAYEQLWRSAALAVPADCPPPFTPRMLEVCFLLVDGATDHQIARRLGVSTRTVSAEVRSICRRTGAASRTHAIARICDGF